MVLFYSTEMTCIPLDFHCTLSLTWHCSKLVIFHTWWVNSVQKNEYDLFAASGSLDQGVDTGLPHTPVLHS